MILLGCLKDEKLCLHVDKSDIVDSGQSCLCFPLVMSYKTLTAVNDSHSLCCHHFYTIVSL